MSRNEGLICERGFAMVRKVIGTPKLYAKHMGHENHLCELVARRQMDKVAWFSKGARHVCYICGRAAAKGDNLCEPVKI